MKGHIVYPFEKEINIEISREIRHAGADSIQTVFCLCRLFLISERLQADYIAPCALNYAFKLVFSFSLAADYGRS